MPSQAITQEELFLPLLNFLADHGGEIDRQRDRLLDSLAERLGITEKERQRGTDDGRNQWTSTVENSRRKLLDIHRAIEPSSVTGIWTLSKEGWKLVRNPPKEMQQKFEAWKRNRLVNKPEEAPEPPDHPSGDFDARMTGLQETLSSTTNVVLRRQRNQSLVRALKESYGYRCQLCSPEQPECPRIQTIHDLAYVEVHHVEGLAEVAGLVQQGQLDVEEYINLTSYHNLIVVCPYHHRLLHFHHPTVSFFRDELRFRDAASSATFPVKSLRGRHLKPS